MPMTLLSTSRDLLRLVADHGPILTGPTMPLVRGVLLGRAVLERREIQIADLSAEMAEYPEGSEAARRLGFRTTLAVPLTRAGNAIGVIVIRRTEIRPFSTHQIDLLKTFADQAVIAIENARLFEAEQASNPSLQESLEYQTATGDVLGVISRSPTNVQPVFNTIAKSAAQLCNAQFCHVFRYDGQLIHFAASHGQTPESIETMRRTYPISPGRVSASARSILTGVVEEIADIHADSDYGHGSNANYRSIVAVPMLKDGRPVGAICMARSETGDFPEGQIELLRTFADQAVIAIENTRLFEEVQQKNQALIESNTQLTETLEQQTASSEILRVISTSPTNLQPVLDTVVKSAARFCGAPDASIFRLDGENLRADAHHGPVSQPPGFLVPVVRGTVAGRAVLERRAIHVTDLQAEIEQFPEGSALSRQIGQRAMLVAPLLLEGVPTGVIVLRRVEATPFTDKQIALLKTFADQAVIAIENTRLFQEVQAKTRELAKTVEDLEIASQHKSQFVANMSHELRTPLAAILGYAELMQEGFYEPLGQKSLDALTRIRSNGKHLLGLINTVLDIAKIESGQFTL